MIDGVELTPCFVRSGYSYSLLLVRDGASWSYKKIGLVDAEVGMVVLVEES